MPEPDPDTKKAETTTYDVFISVAAMASITIVIWLFKPIYVRLPLEYQEGIKRRWAAINDYMQVAVYDRIGWKAKAKPEKRRGGAPKATGGVAKKKQ